MLEIVLYNMVFWTVWIMICMLPQNMMRYVIENHENIFEKK
jgi:hypothetical protein